MENIFLTIEKNLLILYDNNNFGNDIVKDNYENQSYFLQVETIKDKTTIVEYFIDLLTRFYSEIIDYILHVIDSFVQIKYQI